MNERTALGKFDESPDGRAVHAGQGNFSAGEALVQPALNRIAIHGRVAQVEPKVMQVLLLMAQRPGAVISRDTFLDTVWAGTIGDDYLLNRAVSELRRILEDDPQAPRYIETIRKGGYRLIAPIAPARVAEAVAAGSDATGPEIASRADPAVAPMLPGAGGAAPPEPGAPGVEFPARPTPRMQRIPAGHALAATGIVAIAVGVFLFLARTPAGFPDDGAGYEVRPLTSLVGRELEPALSPDGSRVAFIWDGGGNGRFDLYVKTLGNEDLLALTHGTADAHYPLWTADGGSLLFARSNGGSDKGGDEGDDGGTAILRVSSLGGGQTVLFRDPAARQIRGMSRSPDGRHIAYAARPHAGAPYRLVVAALDGGERRIITRPPPGTLGDIDPRYTPDGHGLVFVRATNEVTKDLYRAPLDGTDAVRLTTDNRKINGLAWSPDGQRLLFTSTRAGMYGLWSADADGSDLRPLALGNENVQQPATAAGVDAVAFEQWTHRSQLRRIDLAGTADSDAGQFLRSTRWDSNPAWSPDGTHLAFASNRSGPYAIWVSRHDGHDAVQIAEFDGAFVDNPAWSPDGRRIAFDASPQGKTTIYATSPEGGRPQRLVEGPGDNRNPSWSRDGAWLYFESNRSGQWRIYAQPAAGGAAVAVSPGPGIHPRESADGRQLLYTKPDARGVWQRPREDWRHGAHGAESLLVADLAAQDGANWAPAADALYFVRRPAGDTPHVARFDPARASSTDIVALPTEFEGLGLDVSPDARQLVLAELAMRESDLRLAVPRQATSRR